MEGFVTTIEAQSQPGTTQAEYAAARWYELGAAQHTPDAMAARVAMRAIPGWSLGLLWGVPVYAPTRRAEVVTPDPEHVAAGYAQRECRPFGWLDNTPRSCPRCGSERCANAIPATE